MSTLDRQTDDAGAPRPAAHNAGSIPEHEAIAALGEYDRHAIGPRRTGGVYRSGCGGQTYRVDAVLTGTAARAEIPWSDYAIVEIDLDGDMPGLRRVHCTAWETWPGARVVSFPFEGDDLDPYLADVERVAQLYERRGAPDVANAWRQGAAMVTSGQMSYHGWRVARELLAEDTAAAERSG